MKTKNIDEFVIVEQNDLLQTNALAKIKGGIGGSECLCGAGNSNGDGTGCSCGKGNTNAGGDCVCGAANNNSTRPGNPGPSMIFG